MNTSLLGLKSAECPICLESMSEPIYQCNTGHSFCNDCVSVISLCPTCAQPMSGKRNYTLESVLKELMLSTTSENEYDCLLNSECAFTGGLKELRAHLENKHKNKIIVCNSELFSVTFKDLKKVLLSEYISVEHFAKIIFYDNNMFKLCMKINHNEGMAYFAMQMVDFTEDCGYSFEVDYIRCVRKNKFVAKVSKPTTDLCAFKSSFLKIPKNFFGPQNEYRIFGRFRNGTKN